MQRRTTNRRQPGGGVAIAAGFSILLASLTISPGAGATDGALDPTFDGGGRVTTDFGALLTDAAAAVALQGDGKILVAGYSFATGSEDFAVARYLAGSATLAIPTLGHGTLLLLALILLALGLGRLRQVRPG